MAGEVRNLCQPRSRSACQSGRRDFRTEYGAGGFRTRIGIPFERMTALRPSLISLFLRHAWQWLRGAARILHRLWLEVTGVMFLSMAAFAVPSILREWRAYQGGGPLWKPMSAVLFLCMMAGFGVYSFLKARRLR